jgi:hypothetical protein
VISWRADSYIIVSYRRENLGLIHKWLNLVQARNGWVGWRCGFVQLLCKYKALSSNSRPRKKEGRKGKGREGRRKGKRKEKEKRRTKGKEKRKEKDHGHTAIPTQDSLER